MSLAPVVAAPLVIPSAMLASPLPQPFSRAGWWFEMKYDGMRAMIAVQDGTTRVVGRRGREESFRLPEAQRIGSAAGGLDMILDTEVVALDALGRPDFERLQSRINVSTPRAAQSAAERVPVTFCAFDLLHLDGQSLISRPLEERSALLQEVCGRLGAPLLFADHVDEQGEAFFAAVKAQGLEGMVAKRRLSLYQPGRRGPDWIKVKAWRSQTCAVIGITEGHGRPGHLGAMVLAVRDGDTWVHCGEVGTGLSDSVIRAVTARVSGLRRETPVVTPTPKLDEAVTWVTPEILCEVRHAGFTRGGTLRQPSLLGLRPDAGPEDCARVDG